MAKDKRIRVLMAKPGMDGHWRGLVIVTQALRDAGMEVIHGGNMSVQQIAQTAVQEDVDVVGLSIMTGNVVGMTESTLKELKKAGKGDVLLIIGGVISEDDIPTLEKLGVDGIFTSGTPLHEIVEFVQEHVGKPKAKK
ncbi:MAG: cobalamin-dependent protein [Dehalococcoidia bacterium]|nr:cobalamin-dependent protein [Dehalococcoidia bacterium]